MPIKVQSDLPAKEQLENENIFVMDESRAMHQDIRPLKVVVLNLLIKVIETWKKMARDGGFLLKEFGFMVDGGMY